MNLLQISIGFDNDHATIVKNVVYKLNHNNTNMLYKKTSYNLLITFEAYI